MARIRDINDIDEDEDGQIVDYSSDSDCDNKSKEDLPEEIFQRRPAPGLRALDISQSLQYSILREGLKVGKLFNLVVSLRKSSLHFLYDSELIHSLSYLLAHTGTMILPTVSAWMVVDFQTRLVMR